MKMDEYNYLFDEIADDIKIMKKELLSMYKTSNRSMILKKSDIPIGILIMEICFYNEINEIVNFIKILWVKNEYRNKGYGKNIINNLMKYNIPIVLGVEKTNIKAINFYKKNLFEIIFEEPIFLWMKREN